MDANPPLDAVIDNVYRCGCQTGWSGTSGAILLRCAQHEKPHRHVKPPKHRCERYDPRDGD